MEAQAQFNQEIREDVDFIRSKVDELEAKITSTDENYFTIAGYCSLHHIPCPLHKAQEWGKTATTLSRQRGLPTGTAHDERFGWVRTYHREVLEKIIDE